MKKHRAVLGKIAYSLLILVIYLFGRNIPIPWAAAETSDPAVSGVQDFVSSMLGSGTDNSVLTLGIMPMVTANIITSLFRSKTVTQDRAERSSEKRQKRWTMVLTLCIAIFQGYQRCRSMTFTLSPGVSFRMAFGLSWITMVGGSFAVIALARRNERWGVGGQSLLILTNVITRILRSAVSAAQEFTDIRTDVLLTLAGIVIILATILLDKSEIHLGVRRSLMHNSYSKDNYIAIKLSPVGSMTAMYVMTVFSLLYSLCDVLNRILGGNVILQRLMENLDLYHYGGLAVYAVLLCLMNLALSMTLIDPSGMAERLQKGDDYIAGVRPGQETKRFLRSRVHRLSAFSSAVLCILVILPMAVRIAWNSDASIFMMPVSLMVLTNSIGSIGEEIRVLQVMNNYER